MAEKIISDRKSTGATGEGFVQWKEGLMKQDPNFKTIINLTKLAAVESSEDKEKIARSVGIFWGHWNLNHIISLYLKETMELTLRQRALMPATLETRCMDGRCGGCKRCMMSPLAMWISTTDGGVYVTDRSNTMLHELFNRVIGSESEKPALLFACGHHGGEHGSNCAKVKTDLEKSLGRVATPQEVYDATVAHMKSQADALRKMYDSENLFIAYAMTNTSNGSEKIWFSTSNDTDIAIDPSELLDKLRITNYTDLFDEDFLANPPADTTLNKFMNGYGTIGELLKVVDTEKQVTPFFDELKPAMAMQTHLMELIHQDKGNSAIKGAVLEAVTHALKNASVSPRLMHAFTYRIIGNMAHTLQRKLRRTALTAIEGGREIQKSVDEHNEKVMVFEIEGGSLMVTMPRNTAFIIQNNSGKTPDTLALGKKVMEHVHPGEVPIVHLNVQVRRESLTSWNAINTEIISPLNTYFGLVGQVFAGSEAHVMTTYSILGEGEEETCFPIGIKPYGKVPGAERVILPYPVDIFQGLEEEIRAIEKDIADPRERAQHIKEKIVERESLLAVKKLTRH